MQLVPSRYNFSTQVKALFKKRQRLPLGALISFFVSHEAFDLMCEETADRSLTASSENLGLLEHLPT
jgi:hypothetical protein